MMRPVLSKISFRAEAPPIARGHDRQKEQDDVGSDPKRGGDVEYEVLKVEYL